MGAPWHFRKCRGKNSRDFSLNSYDLIVSGGGTAGMAAAIHAASSGLKVLVFDASGPDYDKPCGEGLMPLAIAHLAMLGVPLPETHPLVGIRYILPRYNGRTVEATFGTEQGIGIRRLKLRASLWERARQVGVTIREEAVQDIRDDGTMVRVGDCCAKYCIVAEGIHSQTVKKLGLKKSRTRYNRFGVRIHLRIKPWNDFVEVWWGPDFEVYITPVAPDVINVALLANRAMTLPAALAALPVLQAKLDLSLNVNELAGAGPLLHRTRRRRVGRILIAGDAAGFVDAMTGEGNTLALGSGIAASEAVLSGRLWLFPFRWWQVVWRYWFLTRMSAGAAVRPKYREFALKMIVKFPMLLQFGLRFLAPPSRDRIPLSNWS